jgi:sulfoxide reductase catalytic subunit YedY
VSAAALRPLSQWNNTMLIKPSTGIRSSEVTPRKLYVNRRQFIQQTTGAAIAAAAGGILGSEALLRAATPAAHGRKLPNVKKNPTFSVSDAPNSWEQITTYNNYYEFGPDKDDPADNARNFKTEPWKVTIDGECNKKAAWNLEDVLKGETFEERVYRHRCVEAWSMIIPWVGFPLANLIKRCEPTSKAKYVKFTTLADPGQMPGVRVPLLRWPYVEGLRMDEAMHPLTILVVGLYGEVLPNQDGAPLRLAVPWKYGFKHVKSIVRIEFTEKEPLNTWQAMQANEYGFYANVNPTVDHPRWTQATERAIGGGIFRKKTLMFNGYGDQVASLYSGMDLKKFY